MTTWRGAMMEQGSDPFSSDTIAKSHLSTIMPKEADHHFDGLLPFFDPMGRLAHNPPACIQPRALPCTTSNMPIPPASVSGRAR